MAHPRPGSAAGAVKASGHARAGVECAISPEGVYYPPASGTQGASNPGVELTGYRAVAYIFTRPKLGGKKT